MKDVKKARSNSFYFPSQYSDPFHRDEKRIERLDFQNFDPYSPSSRQVVANCKKHRSQKHDLSDKCKQVLSIIDIQERLLSVKNPVSTGQTTTVQADILIKFGDGIPKISKDFIKYWIASSGLVKEPFSREYDVHMMEDEHKHNDRFTIVLKVPFFETEIESQDKEKQIIDAFMEDPEKFADNFPVKPVLLYGRNKISGEDDAFGVSIEGHPGPIAMIEGKHVEPINKAIRFTDSAEDAYANMTASEQRSLMETENRYRNSRDRLKALHRKIDNIKEDMDDTEREAAQTEKKDKTLRQKEILNHVMSPGEVIAPNRVEGGWTNPIGQSLRALESTGKLIGSAAGAMERHNEYKAKVEAAQNKLDKRMKRLLEESNDAEEQAIQEESDMDRNLNIAESNQTGRFEEASSRMKAQIEKPVQKEKEVTARIEADAKKRQEQAEQQKAKEAPKPKVEPEAAQDIETDEDDVDVGEGILEKPKEPVNRTFEWGPDVAEPAQPKATVQSTPEVKKPQKQDNISE